MTNVENYPKTYSLGSVVEKTFIELQVVKLGKDLLVVFSGGVSHIGALAHTRKQNGDPVYEYTFPEHRDDVIVEKVMQALQAEVGGELLVAGGIHYDDITKDQIDRIIQNCDQLLAIIRSDLPGMNGK